MPHAALRTWLTAVLTLSSCGGEVVGSSRAAHGGAGGTVDEGGSGSRPTAGGSSSGGRRGTGGADAGPAASGEADGDPDLDAGSGSSHDAAVVADAATDALVTFDCEDPPPPEPRPAPPLDVLRPLADTYCSLIERCFPALYPVPTFCRDQILCTRESLAVPAITDSALTTCTATLEALAECPAAPTPLPCPPLWGGTAREGESCHGVTCQAGLYCRHTSEGTCPICARRRVRGAPCGPGDECEPDHQGSGDPGTCKPTARLGGTCSPELPCGYGRCLEGICRAPLGEGEACASLADCGAGLACVDSRCSRAFAFAGDACSPTLPCVGGTCEGGRCIAVCADGVIAPGHCTTDATCAPEEACDTSTWRCAPRPGPGDPCSPFRSECRAGHYCDVDRGCAPLRPAGQRCTAGVQCTSTYCLNGVCTPMCACPMP